MKADHLGYIRLDGDNIKRILNKSNKNVNWIHVAEFKIQ